MITYPPPPPTEWTTLKLVRAFMEAAADLGTISGFTYGSESEILGSTELNYPHVFLAIPTNTLQRRNTRRMTFSLTVIDRGPEDLVGNRTQTIGNNSAKMYTNTERLSQQILARVNANYDLLLEPNFTISATPVHYKLKDLVWGWKLTITVISPWALDSCELPLACTESFCDFNPKPNPLHLMSNSPCEPNYLTCDTLQECQLIVDILNQLGDGLSCETLVDCDIIQTILLEIEELRGRVDILESTVSQFQNPPIWWSQPALPSEGREFIPAFNTALSQKIEGQVTPSDIAILTSNWFVTYFIYPLDTQPTQWQIDYGVNNNTPVGSTFELQFWSIASDGTLNTQLDSFTTNANGNGASGLFTFNSFTRNSPYAMAWRLGGTIDANWRAWGYDRRFTQSILSPIRHGRGALLTSNYWTFLPTLTAGVIPSAIATSNTFNWNPSIAILAAL